MTAIQDLLAAAEKVVSQIDPVEFVKARKELERQLDRFRCTCGRIPAEGRPYTWAIYCCGYEWDSWEDFLEWKDAQT